jgi:hypothetical protein
VDRRHPNPALQSRQHGGVGNLRPQRLAAFQVFRPVAEFDVTFGAIEQSRAQHPVSESGQAFGGSPHMRVHAENFLHHDQRPRRIDVSRFKRLKLVTIRGGKLHHLEPFRLALRSGQIPAPALHR